MKTFTYVYVLQSETDSRRFYTGCTLDLRKRLVRHNNGEVPHTSKWTPSRIKTYIAFSDRVQAKDFERFPTRGGTPNTSCRELLFSSALEQLQRGRENNLLPFGVFFRGRMQTVGGYQRRIARHLFAKWENIDHA